MEADFLLPLLALRHNGQKHKNKTTPPISLAAGCVTGVVLSIDAARRSNWIA